MGKKREMKRKSRGCCPLSQMAPQGQPGPQQLSALQDERPLSALCYRETSPTAILAILGKGPAGVVDQEQGTEQPVCRAGPPIDRLLGANSPLAIRDAKTLIKRPRRVDTSLSGYK